MYEFTITVNYAEDDMINATIKCSAFKITKIESLIDNLMIQPSLEKILLHCGGTFESAMQATLHCTTDQFITIIAHLCPEVEVPTNIYGIMDFECRFTSEIETNLGLAPIRPFTPHGVIHP